MKVKETLMTLALTIVSRLWLRSLKPEYADPLTIKLKCRSPFFLLL
jgi:hypothetical protein